MTQSDDVQLMNTLTHRPFYLAFTDGWGDEPIVRCEPVAQSAANPRLVVCAVQPPIAHQRTVVLYDRFSEGSWLPLEREAEVGVLLGDVEADKEPNVRDLELASWATIFVDENSARLARERLRPSGQA